MDRLLLWLHLTSLAVLIGALAALVVVVLPMLERVEEHHDRLRLAAASFSRMNPLLIGVLGVVVMSGAYSLTAYKARLGGEFFARIGEPLAWKLVLSFVFIMGVTYVTFGLSHRIVRMVQWDEPLPPEKLASMLRRVRTASYFNLALAAWIVWVALRIPGGAP